MYSDEQRHQLAALLRKSKRERLGQEDEQRLRYLVSLRDPRAVGRPYNELLKAGFFIIGYEAVLRQIQGLPSI